MLSNVILPPNKTVRKLGGSVPGSVVAANILGGESIH